MSSLYYSSTGLLWSIDKVGKWCLREWCSGIKLSWKGRVLTFGVMRLL